MSEKYIKVRKLHLKKCPNTSGDKEDLEDSGVHLDEPLTPKSWAPQATDPTKLTTNQVAADLVRPLTSDLFQMTHQSEERTLLEQEFTNKCVVTGNPMTCSQMTCGNQMTCSPVTCSNQMTTSVRSKSESPHHFSHGQMTVSCHELVFESEIKNCSSHTERAENCDSTPRRGKIRCHSEDLSPDANSLSSPDLPEHYGMSGTTNVHFTLDSDAEDDDSDTNVSVMTNNSQSGVTTQPQSALTSRTQTREQRKGRFKKMLRPLYRSHSAGCGKDVPAHALFLRHEHKLEKRQQTNSGKQAKTKDRTNDRKSAEISITSSTDSEKDESVEKGKKVTLKKKKSIAKDMKEKLLFLRRRHTDTALSSRDKSKFANVLDWSKSFENLLSDKYGLELFRVFLRTEFSEENIEFWIACELYKSVKSAKLQERAQQIYSDFVAVQAPKEINLDSKTRLATIASQGDPNRHTFENAQRRIQALMEKDSYPRFLRSETYQELLAAYNKTNT